MRARETRRASPSPSRRCDGTTHGKRAGRTPGVRPAPCRTAAPPVVRRSGRGRQGVLGGAGQAPWDPSAAPRLSYCSAVCRSMVSPWAAVTLRSPVRARRGSGSAPWSAQSSRPSASMALRVAARLSRQAEREVQETPAEGLQQRACPHRRRDRGPPRSARSPRRAPRCSPSGAPRADRGWCAPGRRQRRRGAASGRSPAPWEAVGARLGPQCRRALLSGAAGGRPLRSTSGLPGVYCPLSRTAYPGCVRYGSRQP
jgi:hypothetical protein